MAKGKQQETPAENAPANETPATDSKPEAATETKKRGKPAKVFQHFERNVLENLPDNLEQREIQYTISAAVYVDENGKVCKASAKGAKVQTPAVIGTFKSMPLPKLIPGSGGGINDFLTHFKNVKGFDAAANFVSGYLDAYEKKVVAALKRTKDPLDPAATETFIPEFGELSTPDPVKVLGSKLEALASKAPDGILTAEEYKKMYDEMLSTFGLKAPPAQ